MTYVFHRSNVRMTIPSRLSCSPRAISSLSATAATMRILPLNLQLSVFEFQPKTVSRQSRRLILRLLPRTLIIHLYLGFVADGADDLVASGYDLVIFLQSAGDLDVGGSGDAGLHLAKRDFASGNDKHALDLLL